MHVPALKSENVTLNALDSGDISTLQRLLNDADVAEMMLDLPHPFLMGDAKSLVNRANRPVLHGTILTLGIVPLDDSILLDDDTLVGCVSIAVHDIHNRAEIGYWVGQYYSGRGYATEAVRLILHYGFEIAGLNRMYARVFSENLPSIRVMEKCGLQFEGEMKRHLMKNLILRDVKYYGLVRRNWHNHV